MKYLTFVLVLTLTTVAVDVAEAAKPKSIKYVEDLVLKNDTIYAHYVVSCSDGTYSDISAWDNRKLWCVGKGTRDSEACAKKQIKIAKRVCSAA